MKEFKQKLVDSCRQLLNEKTQRIKNLLDEMSAAMENETKSSVGDKHETARARMQAEEEKLQIQLKELSKMTSDFEKTLTNTTDEKVGLGSLVQTNHGVFFVAVALGKIEVEEQAVFVISKEAPIASQMLGLKTNQSFDFNENGYVIKNVL